MALEAAWWPAFQPERRHILLQYDTEWHPEHTAVASASPHARGVCCRRGHSSAP